MSQNTAIVPFSFESKEVRTIQDEHGNPWFIAKDVCNILDIQQPTKAVGNLDDDEVNKSHLVDSLGKKQEMITISESGLYTLIIRSNKPEAKKFRKWVTAEVLPAIRKTGTYRAVKTCSKCNQSLPMDAFGKDASTPDGMNIACRKCRNNIAAIHREKKRSAVNRIESGTTRLSPETGGTLHEEAGKFKVLFERICDTLDDDEVAMNLWSVFHNLSLVFIGRSMEIKRQKNIDSSPSSIDQMYARLQWLEIRYRM